LVTSLIRLRKALPCRSCLCGRFRTVEIAAGAQDNDPKIALPQCWFIYGGGMKIVCKCGMDCTDFCSQHAIPQNARFACPDCDSPLTASCSQGAAQSGGVSVTERMAEDALTA